VDEIRVTTQEELDAALKRSNNGTKALVLLTGGGAFSVTGATVTAYGSSTVRAYGSSTVRAYGSSTVTAYGSSTVRASGSSTVTAYDSSTVTAYDSSTVTAYDSSTVTAYGSSTVRAYGSSTVTAYGSSTVTAYGSSTVTAYDSSTVTAYGSSTVTASKWVAVSLQSPTATANGGVIIRIPKPATPAEWCEFHGVTTNDGVAILFKGVDAEFRSPKRMLYTPGTVPVAENWDGMARECGGGLHFSPTPHHTLEFTHDAKRFVACPVRLEDIVVHPDGEYPQKIKARCCCAPVWECDIDGNRIETK
jgi:hypothetical protein